MLALPDSFTSRTSTERLLTGVLGDGRSARGEEIRHWQRQAQKGDSLASAGADPGEVAPSRTLSGKSICRAEIGGQDSRHPPDACGLTLTPEPSVYRPVIPCDADRGGLSRKRATPSRVTQWVRLGGPQSGKCVRKIGEDTLFPFSFTY